MLGQQCQKKVQRNISDGQLRQIASQQEQHYGLIEHYVGDKVVDENLLLIELITDSHYRTNSNNVNLSRLLHDPSRMAVFESAWFISIQSIYRLFCLEHHGPVLLV
ncbi:hypothetical protein Tcan_07558 [Toxocara canis]|uniref:Uncharacterized protein n=1 Tax=Toxocara canis TaxID=6265 RepID=A0A0B2VT85_TOXCA|nr:hypothetical protein Tcan_07558 [Toxocara canis]